MTTITEFLLARITEDEAVAKAATLGPWHWEGDYPKGHCPHDTEWTDHGPDLISSVALNDEYGPDYEAVITSSGYDASGLNIEDCDADFIAHNDPARVLAECAAKRAILKYREWIDRGVGMDDWYAGCSDANLEAIKALAAVYADHPDYRQDWAL